MVRAGFAQGFYEIFWESLRVKNLSGKRATLPPEREPETQFNWIFYLAVFIFIIIIY